MNKKGTKALASATLMSLVLTTALATGNVKAAAGQVTRVGGTDRYETAAKVATANFADGSENVILVNGLSYADSVSASALAKTLNAPILLTTADTLNADAKDALNTLKPKNVYIVGGEAAVSKSVADSLSDYSVTRLSGANRYATNLAVANELVKNHGVSKDNLLVVTGQAYSDALSAAPVAAAKGEILLLSTNDKTAMGDTYDFAKDSDVTVIGTTNSVDAATYSSLNADKRVDGGANRFETNLNILDTFKDDLKADKLYVATAKPNASGANDTQFADALVASAIAGKYSAPLVLTNSDADDDTATNNAISYIGKTATKDTDLEVVGGTGVVSDTLVGKINDAVEKEPPFDGTVTSVETVADQTVNAKADDEQLQFTVNGGQKVSVADLNAKGYTVTFNANKNVFGTSASKASTSDDGILTKDNLQSEILDAGDDSFKYSVIISKDGVTVASTPYETVDVISGDETATSISDVTLKKEVAAGTKDSVKDGKITSGKIVDGESIYVDKVKGALVNGGSDVTVTNLDFSSSNPFVATVAKDSDGTAIITTVGEGNFDLIVKSGNSTKKVPLQVVTEARRATSATASVSSLSLAQGATQNFDLTFKDQYGDVFAGATPSVDSSVTSGGDEIATTSFTGNTDKDGKISVSVLASTSKTGSGYVNVKDANGLNIFKLPVKVVNEAGSNVWKVEPKDSDSKSLTLDLNPQSNDDSSVSTDNLKLNINKYTNSGAISGQDTIDHYKFTLQVPNDPANVNNYVKLYDASGTNPLTETSAGSGIYTTTATDNYLVVKAAGPTAKVGSVTLKITNNDSNSDNKDTSKTITIKTKDSSPSIASSSTLKDKTITDSTLVGSADTSETPTTVVSPTSTTLFNIKDVVDVDNLKINGSAGYGDGKIRLAQDGTLFINVAKSGETQTSVKDINDSTVSYDQAQDVTIGYVKVTPATDKGDLYSVTMDPATGDISPILTKDKTKGKFTVGITSVHGNNVIVSKDVNIDVTQY
ncbi:cell wall-binding repeat-containing protein [Clostridium tyrobutyricum]|uniref:cell wall-binding repeat-containing protein n=1 Tax=Clostridium tyrobutyricum TaxID=1519 RepID=UPI00189FA068|nr:cell wall-binding repeat-containing protein [Clostridium tyrobutyricum]